MFAHRYRKGPDAMKPTRKLVLYVGLLCLLALVFAMYGRPDFLLMLANQMWSCF